MTAKEPIHSGHFMTSNPHKPDEDDEDYEVTLHCINKSITTKISGRCCRCG